MALYNNRATIAHIDEEELYLFRNIDNKIIMDYFSSDDESKQDTIIEDALGEFDILINQEDEIYLIYQNIDHHLSILTIDKEVINQVSLTQEGLAKVYELNIIETLDCINIIYVVLKSSKDGIFEIHHHLLKSGQWINHMVEEIKIDRFLNPIKVLDNEKGIRLCYYYENQICIKEFNFESMEWQESLILTDNNPKLYMDIIREDNNLHLVYSQYENENLMIKYGRYKYSENSIVLEEEIDISKEGNPSNPTLIIEGSRLWIVWNESAKLLSRYSDDRGLSWSPIYLWKKSRFTDMLRYKYITKTKGEGIYLDYGFGTLHPDIEFLGFGPLHDVEEIMDKKKVLNQIFQV